MKLVEYGSMTCPHCAAFSAEAMRARCCATYVKSGRVSWEFRNYVRDAFDLAASLVARCNGTKTFFPVTRAIFADQENWENRIQAMPQDQFKAMQDLPPNQQFVAIAKAFYHTQLDWEGKLQKTPQPQSSKALQNLPENQIELEVVHRGFHPGGVSNAKATQCLTDTKRIDQIVNQSRVIAEPVAGLFGHSELRDQRHAR